MKACGREKGLSFSIAVAFLLQCTIVNANRNLGMMLIGSQLKACGREKGLSFGIAIDDVMRLSELRKLVLPMSWGVCCMAMSLLGVGSLCSPISVILSVKFNEALAFQDQ